MNYFHSWEIVENRNLKSIQPLLLITAKLLALWFLFGRLQGQVICIMIKVLYDIPQSLQANNGISTMRPQSPSTFSFTNYLFRILMTYHNFQLRATNKSTFFKFLIMSCDKLSSKLIWPIGMDNQTD